MVYHEHILLYVRTAPAQKTLQQLGKKDQNNSKWLVYPRYHFRHTRNATFALFFQSLRFPPAYFRV